MLRARDGGKEENLDGFNLTNFDEIETTAFRVTLYKESKGDYGVGIVEWKVYGSFAEEKAPAVDTPTTDTAPSDEGESGCGASVGTLPLLALALAPVLLKKRRK